MFYLMTHSTHFIYGYMASDIWLTTILEVEGRKEGNVLFNDALNTFYLQLYGVRYNMVKDHSGSGRKEVNVLLNDALDTFYFTVIWKEGNVLFNDALNSFYLRIYGVGHMVKYHSDSERGRKEGNVLFNDALNTFYLRLYGVRHNMVKDHSGSEKENLLPPH